MRKAAVAATAKPKLDRDRWGGGVEQKWAGSQAIYWVRERDSPKVAFFDERNTCVSLHDSTLCPLARG